MSELKKKDNESLLQYRARLYRDKINIGLNNREIYELYIKETGDTIAESSCRCSASTYNQALEDTLESITKDNGSEALQELEDKRMKLEKERKKLQTTSIEYNKMLREQARDELIYEKVKDCIQSLDVPEFKPIQINNEEKEWVLAFGDVHFDKFFESVNNEYSISEVYKRFDLLASKIISEIEKENINRITICNLGDSLEGLLRISALRTMRLGLLESVVCFSRFMAKWLNNLSRYVLIDYYHVPTANHMELRMFNQKRGETDENLERLIVNYIHDLLKNNQRVNVILTKDNVLEFNLLGFNFLLAHGDGIKNIKSCLKDFSIQRRKFIDYVLLGHFHSGIEQTVAEGDCNNMEIIVIPSIVGSDTYSDSLFLGSKSTAKLLGFSKGEGHTDTKNIILN